MEPNDCEEIEEERDGISFMELCESEIESEGEEETQRCREWERE